MKEPTTRTVTTFATAPTTWEFPPCEMFSHHGSHLSATCWCR